MTQEEINDYNRRCAEFLGYQILNKKFQYENYNSSNESYFSWTEGNIVCDKKGNIVYIDTEPLFELEELPFNSDWNRIHEVVNGIKNTTKPKIHSDTTFSTYLREIQFDLGISNKEGVIELINNFLIWYEKNTK